MLRVLGIIILGTLAIPAYSQKQTYNWFFGHNAGLNFSGGAPVFQQGSLNTVEGSSSISDTSGQLLFYTDGRTIWSKNHQQMLNGNGLAGGSGSSTQSSLIIPYPGNDSLYYVFTANEENAFVSSWFYYSIVNMNRNNGLGEVITKNVFLLGQYGQEKIAGIKHENGTDIWVVTNKWLKNEFYEYRITANGLITTPKIVTVGSIGGRDDVRGYMKFSPDGKKLAVCYPSSHIEVLDFDVLTGAITNPKIIPKVSPTSEGPYGIEFSCDSRLLYVSEIFSGQIYGLGYALLQYRLDLTSVTDIINSKVTLDFSPTNPKRIGALQMGPDGKIYITFSGELFLGAITKPGVYGTGCGYAKQYFIFPSPITGEFGLPNFVQSYFNSPADFQAQNNCSAGSFSFELTQSGADSVAWNFGDPASGSGNFSSLLHPTHFYSSNGTYTAKAVIYKSCRTDTVQKTVNVTIVNSLLGADTFICEGSTLTLRPSLPGAIYQWQNGSTNNSFQVATPGLYWVRATFGNCVYGDSIVVLQRPLPQFSLGNDTTICENTTLLLDVSSSNGDNYTWNDGMTSPTHMVKNRGTYWVSVSKGGCMKSDSISIAVQLLPKPNLGADVEICEGDTVVLQGSVSGSVVWSDGSTGPALVVSKPGLYSIVATNTCGSVKDEITVNGISCEIYFPTAFTPNADGKNDLFQAAQAYRVSHYQLQIFNRWGQKVFETTYPLKGWDGTAAGKNQDTGIFVWNAQYTDAFGKKRIAKGTVALIR